MTPLDLIMNLRFSDAIEAIYTEYRDSVVLTITWRRPGSGFIEAARPNGRRWQTLAMQEWRDGHRPPRFWLANPITPGRQQRREVLADELVYTADSPAA